MIPILPIFLGFLILQAAHKLHMALHKKRIPRDSSVLLATFGSSYMAETHRGKSGPLYYSIVVSMGALDVSQPNASRGGVIYRVDLPFTTKVHLLSIPKSEEEQIDPRGTYMEPVVLEGDFPDYFSLYAEKGMQAQARYVLDPKAMQFVMEFCRTHNWEIIGDQLIFLHANTSTEHDIEEVMATVNGFIATIRPALELPVSEEREVARAAYGQERRKLRCPICLRHMDSRDQRYLVCPDGHGILAYGSALADIRNNTLVVDIPNKSSSPHGVLTCPSCRNTMRNMLYGTTDIEIDTCTSCPYRWLDADAVESIRMPENLATLDIGSSTETVYIDMPTHTDSNLSSR